MKEKIEQFLAQKAKLEEEFQEYIRNKDISLEERWDLFIESGLGGIFEGEFPGVDWSKHTFYDDFYMERYSVSNVDKILELGIEYNIFEENGEIEFKEWCLENFINQIENDW